MLPLALLLALAAQPAGQATPAPAWRPLGVSANGRQTFYDPASVVRSGPVTRVRVRFTEPDAYSLSMVELRCAAYEARVIGIVSYAPDGSERNRNDMASPFRTIRPGGFLETLAGELCGATQGPARPQ
jgi:hypothetical protein